MRRSLLVAVSTTALVVATGATASAGEVTGNGDPTPVQSYRAASICSFSGLNDDPDSEEPFDGGRVQSFGDIVQEMVQIIDHRGASLATGDIHAFGPGASCRGNGGGH